MGLLATVDGAGLLESHVVLSSLPASAGQPQQQHGMPLNLCACLCCGHAGPPTIALHPPGKDWHACCSFAKIYHCRLLIPWMDLLFLEVPDACDCNFDDACPIAGDEFAADPAGGMSPASDILSLHK